MTTPRLAVVENIYFIPPGEQPTGISNRHERKLLSDEQPYIRHAKLGVEWTKLDTGWLKKGSTLAIRNEEGLALQTIPTDEQTQEIDAKVIEVSLRGDGVVDLLLLPRGDSCRFCPLNPETIFLRCRRGKARVNITLYPE